MSEKITIRPLIKRDRTELTAMIKKLADKLGDSGILNLISSDVSTKSDESGDNKSGDNSYVRVGISIIRQLLDSLEEDLSKWFASLVNKTVEEFDQLPFDAEIQIIEQLADSKEFADFFTGALRLSKKTQGFVKQFGGKKTA